LRLFINLALSAMETHAAKPDTPVLFCLDEFATLGHMQTIENAAGQIAGFGVKLWPILQDLGQLKTLYKDRWETFMGNAGVLQFFGNNDLTTLKWISERLGQTTIRTMNKGEVGYKAATATAATGESWSNEVQPLLTPDEVARFFGREDTLLRQLVILPSLPPIVLQRAYYDKHELFQ
jgi:type IV secretion system protein VirD4